MQERPKGPSLTRTHGELALAVAGVLGGLLYLLGAVINPYHATLVERLVMVPIVILVGWSFLFVGLAATRRRPGNPTGLLMSIVGVTWFAADLGWIPTPWTYAAYQLSRFGFLAVLGHLLIVYPRGRPSRRREMLAVLAVYGWFVASVAAVQLTLDPRQYSCRGCFSNPLYLAGSRDLHGLLVNLTAAGTVVVAALVVALVLRHWVQASPPARRALAPLMWSIGPIFVVVLAIQLSGVGLVPAPVEDVIGPAELVVYAALPAALLVGVLRTRLGRAAVTDLVVELNGAPLAGGLRDALARALGDPSLELALARPSGGFVDSQGQAVSLPASSSRRVVTMIATDGRPLAALLHDRALEEEDPGLVAAAGSAARMALENERLQAEVRASLQEVRASRVRILEAADAERRRLERDIHDGAQQRLAALALDLRLARDRASTLGDASLAAGLDQASEQLKRALEELRELARGIHPAVLTRAGIGPALRSLAEISPVPVDLVQVPGSRYPDAVETAVYFCVSEALANVAKHARASRATVSVRQEGGQLVFRVADDGAGGADPARGTGIVGMTDRVASLGGRLSVSGNAGQGTVVLGELPCG